MPIPTPEPGLVISYNYLWRYEQQRGQEEGRKRRPCVIVLAVEEDGGAVRVTTVPITHSPPEREQEAIEIPLRVKRHLGLDSERSWIVCSEVNRFVWPGFDLQPIAGKPGCYDYGFLPPSLFESIKKRLLILAQERRVPVILRD